jgi:hypothetical protein
MAEYCPSFFLELKLNLELSTYRAMMSFLLIPNKHIPVDFTVLKEYFFKVKARFS